MILEFSIANYRSIKDIQTLSLVASQLKSKDSQLDIDNCLPVSDKLTLLKSVALYGANGSGKSNIVKALTVMLLFIRDSFKDDEMATKLVEPFLLNNENIEKPSFFQLIFILDGVRYRYGFEIKGNSVTSEWLFGTPEKKEVYYFTREGDEIQINKNRFSEGNDLQDKTSSQNLFINICKAFNGSISSSIKDFLSKRISINAGVGDDSFRNSTLSLIKDSDIKEYIISFLKMADLGIGDISTQKITLDNLHPNMPKEVLEKANKGGLKAIFSSHDILDSNGEKISSREFLMDKHESDGTLKFFNYSGVIIRTLLEGNTLILDEFDARLHPSLTKAIVNLFNSERANPNGAQLIFVTHDTNLLSNKLLRRDQIYFVEKNSRFATEIYSLSEFKGIRNSATYEQDYIKGKYGAVPFLGDFNELLN